MARSALGHLSWARGRCGGSVAGAIVRVGNPRERETMRERDGLAHMSPNFRRAVEAELFLAIGRK
jgi:hypothetical protein